MDEITPGDRVAIELPADSGFLKTAWYPKGTVTGTVQKVFKNGKVAVAVDQLYAQGGDSRRTLHFLTSDLRVSE